MTKKELINLLNRAAAALETPGDLSDEEKRFLTEDLVVVAKSLACGVTKREVELVGVLKRLTNEHKGCIMLHSNKPHMSGWGPGCAYCDAVHLVERIEKEERENGNRSGDGV